MCAAPTKSWTVLAANCAISGTSSATLFGQNLKGHSWNWLTYVGGEFIVSGFGAFAKRVREDHGGVAEVAVVRFD